VSTFCFRTGLGSVETGGVTTLGMAAACGFGTLMGASIARSGTLVFAGDRELSVLTALLGGITAFFCDAVAGDAAISGSVTSVTS